MMICGDVIRPALPWMLTRTHRYLASVMAEVRDPDGFARLHQLAAAGPASSRKDAQIAATRIATLLAWKGGRIGDITVGDCVELVGHGHPPEDASATIRAFGLALGQLSIEELVDRYRIRCQPVRDVIVDYLRERQPSLDFASLDAISRTLAGLFWARVEVLAPGIDSLRLPPAVARAWKDDLKVKKRTVVGPDGKSVEVSSPRLNARTNSCASERSTSTSRNGRRSNRPAGAMGRALSDRRRRDPQGKGTQETQSPDGSAHPREAARPPRPGQHHRPAAP
ncbi:hypothetical protein NKH18_51505 [Streptomyces sp. M10(2022)]